MNYAKIEQIGSHLHNCKGMYELLQKYASEGISLYLEGEEAEPGQITATCLREGVSYMMDFIPEDYGNQMITKIDFTKIATEPATPQRHIEEPHPNVSILYCT